MRAQYEVSVVILISATIFLVSYVISWYIKLRYNGNWLYYDFTVVTYGHDLQQRCYTHIEGFSNNE